MTNETGQSRRERKKRKRANVDNNSKLVEALELKCNEFGDQLFSLHHSNVELLRKAKGLVDGELPGVGSPVKRRAAIILKDFWKHDREIYILCAMATTFTALGALCTTDYVNHVQSWWASRASRPGALAQIVRDHIDLLPNTHFTTTTTTIEELTSLMHKVNGDKPLQIFLWYEGTPDPLVQIGDSSSGIRVEMKIHAFRRLLQARAPSENGYRDIARDEAPGADAHGSST